MTPFIVCHTTEDLKQLAATLHSAAGEIRIVMEHSQIQQFLDSSTSIVQHNHQEQIPYTLFRCGIRLCQKNFHFRFAQKFNTRRFRFLLSRDFHQFLVMLGQRNVHHDGVSKQRLYGFEFAVRIVTEQPRCFRSSRKSETIFLPSMS